MKNKVTLEIIACGGAGSNVLANMVDTLKADDMVNIQTMLIDSADANNGGHINRFVHLKDPVNGNPFTGSGGDKRKNFLKYQEAISLLMEKELVDVLQYNPNNPIFRIILTGFGSATGSAVSGILSRYMSKAKIPYLLMGILETRSDIRCDSTLKAIKSLSPIAKMSNSTMSVTIYDNSDGEDIVDEAVMRDTRHLTALISNKNKDLEISDMRTFLMPSLYESITISKEAHLVRFIIGTKIEGQGINLIIPNDKIPNHYRVLSANKLNNLLCLQTDKAGYPKEPDVINYIEKVCNKALYISSTIGEITTYINEVTIKLNKIKKAIMENATPEVEIGNEDTGGIEY